MEHLQEGLAVLGAFVLVGGCLLVIATVWALLTDRLDARRRRFTREGADHERRLLAGDARWFSEDPETMRLLEDFARDPDVSAVRERWRRRRRSPAEHRSEEAALGGGS